MIPARGFLKSFWNVSNSFRWGPGGDSLGGGIPRAQPHSQAKAKGRARGFLRDEFGALLFVFPLLGKRALSARRLFFVDGGSIN